MDADRPPVGNVTMLRAAVRTPLCAPLRRTWPTPSRAYHKVVICGTVSSRPETTDVDLPPIVRDGDEGAEPHRPRLRQARDAHVDARSRRICHCSARTSNL